MKKRFKIKDFDEVNFINSGNETQEILDAKEYLKEIQMSVNIADVNESLFCINDFNAISHENEIEVFTLFRSSIFSTTSLSFLEKVKLLTSFEGLDSKNLSKVNFDSKNNFEYLNSNLVNHCKEFITAIWDCILLIKIFQSRGEKSILIDKFNEFFSQLTKIKTGNASLYVPKENDLDMICELVLFMQFYTPDFFIYLIKSNANISTPKELNKTNKAFIEVLKKSKKIEHRLSMLKQIKSNNYQLLLKLLIDQKNSELR